MSSKNRREKEKSKRRKVSARQWAKEQDSQGGGCFKLPPGVEQYKLKEGLHKIDIMPFTTGDNNPAADAGYVHFCREYELHRVPVAGGIKYVCCRAFTFKDKCAVCNYMRSKGSALDDELRDALKPKRRVLFVVNDKPGSKEVNFKVMETPYFGQSSFGIQLKELIDTDESYDDFCGDGGYTVQYKGKEESMGSGKFIAISRIDFIARKYDYPDELIDEAPCLDEILVDPGYDEVMELLETGGSVEGKSKKASRKPDPDDEDEDDEDSDPDDSELEDEELPAPKSKKGAKPKRPDPDEDEDEDEDEPEEPSDLDKDEDEDSDSELEDEDEEEDEPPVKKGRGRPKKK